MKHRGTRSLLMRKIFKWADQKRDKAYFAISMSIMIFGIVTAVGLFAVALFFFFYNAPNNMNLAVAFLAVNVLWCIFFFGGLNEHLKSRPPYRRG